MEFHDIASPSIKTILNSNIQEFFNQQKLENPLAEGLYIKIISRYMKSQ